MFKKFFVIGAMVLTFVLGASFTHATPLQLFISADMGVTGVVVFDNLPGDTDPTLGVVSWNGTISSPTNNWIANVTTAMTYPILGTPGTPQLDLASVNATSSGGGSLVVQASALDFTLAPTSAVFLTGGTTAGNVVMVAYSGADVYGDKSHVIAFTPTPLTGAFSATLSGGILASPNPYSLTLTTLITHTGAGVTSFDANLSTVPEPATMLLLGSGLIGLAAYGRKKFLKR